MALACLIAAASFLWKSALVPVNLLGRIRIKQSFQLKIHASASKGTSKGAAACETIVVGGAIKISKSLILNLVSY